MISFTVVGTPAQQGSKRIVQPKGAARPRLIEDNDARKKSWRHDVTDAIERWREARPEVAAALPLHGPVVAELEFHLRRPPSAPKRRVLPEVSPDIDKLARNVLDAVTVAGLWRDDAQVTDLVVRKRYAPDGEATGVRVSICPVPAEVP